MTTLSREYPYIYAWGTHLGSFEYYKRAEAEVARADGAPSDVIYRHDLDSLGAEERRAAEIERAAHIVRDEHGEPLRAWHRLRPDSPTRDRVVRMAENYAAGRSPWAK